MTHILIIDDSPTEVHVFKTMLANHNIEVSVAKNGEEGIEKAIEIKPDCILMDVVMPGKNGFQATRDLSRNPETVKPAAERDLIERINKVLSVKSEFPE